MTPDLVSTTPQTVLLPQLVDSLGELGMENQDLQAILTEASESMGHPEWQGASVTTLCSSYLEYF